MFEEVTEKKNSTAIFRQCKLFVTSKNSNYTFAFGQGSFIHSSMGKVGLSKDCMMRNVTKSTENLGQGRWPSDSIQIPFEYEADRDVL